MSRADWPQRAQNGPVRTWAQSGAMRDSVRALGGGFGCLGHTDHAANSMAEAPVVGNFRPPKGGVEAMSAMFFPGIRSAG